MTFEPDVSPLSRSDALDIATEKNRAEKASQPTRDPRDEARDDESTQVPPTMGSIN